MTLSNIDLDLALSTLASPNVASEERGTILCMTARLMLIGLLMMGTAISTGFDPSWDTFLRYCNV